MTYFYTRDEQNEKKHTRKEEKKTHTANAKKLSSDRLGTEIIGLFSRNLDEQRHQLKNNNNSNKPAKFCRK